MTRVRKKPMAFKSNKGREREKDKLGIANFSRAKMTSEFNEPSIKTSSKIGCTISKKKDTTQIITLKQLCSG